MRTNDRVKGDTITFDGVTWTVEEVNLPDQPDRTWLGLANKANPKKHGTAVRLSVLEEMVRDGVASWGEKAAPVRTVSDPLAGRLDEYADEYIADTLIIREDAADLAFAALRSVLEHCAKMETDDQGAPSIVGKAVADTFRGLIAQALKP